MIYRVSTNEITNKTTLSGVVFIVGWALCGFHGVTALHDWAVGLSHRGSRITYASLCA